MNTRIPAPTLPAWLTDQLVGFDRYRINIGERRLHVMERGQGRPVLMVHGNPTWGFLWRRVTAELAGADLRLVLPDLVGLGLADKPRDPAAHTLRNHARWLGALIDALELDDLVLVVQDWGGPIGVRAMADRAERLGGLVVLNTVLGPPRPGFRPTAFHRFSQLPLLSTLVFRGLGFPQAFMWTAQGDRRSIRGPAARAYRYPLRRLRDNVAPLALARMVPDSLAHPSVAPLQECQDFAASYRGPAAIVWGDRDPVLGRVRRRTARLLPQAPVTRTRAGHFLQEEVPREIAAAIRGVSAGCVGETQVRADVRPPTD